MPVLSSVKRQALLGAFGVALIVAALIGVALAPRASSQSNTTAQPSEPIAPTVPNNSNPALSPSSEDAQAQPPTPSLSQNATPASSTPPSPETDPGHRGTAASGLLDDDDNTVAPPPRRTESPQPPTLKQQCMDGSASACSALSTQLRATCDFDAACIARAQCWSDKSRAIVLVKTSCAPGQNQQSCDFQTNNARPQLEMDCDTY